MSSQRILMIILGILLIAGGVLSIALPFASSLAATIIVGWTLILAGVLHLIAAVRETQARWWNGGFGLLEAFIGFSFLFDPLAGMISLAALLGVLFLSAGAMQLWLAWRERENTTVWPLVISGGLSVALGAMIAFNLFTAAATVPGILLGVELISTGAAFLMLRPRQLRRGFEEAHSNLDEQHQK